MNRGSIGRRTSDGTSGAAALEIIAGTRGAFLVSLEINLAAATASTYGLGRPAAKGITPTTPVTILQESARDTALLAATAIAWGTGPTVPAQFFRRCGFPATIATQIFWAFGGQGLWIPPSASVVLWNLATNGVVDVNVVVDEQ